MTVGATVFWLVLIGVFGATIIGSSYLAGREDYRREYRDCRQIASIETCVTHVKLEVPK